MIGIYVQIFISMRLPYKIQLSLDLFRIDLTWFALIYFTT